MFWFLILRMANAANFSRIFTSPLESCYSITSQRLVGLDPKQICACAEALHVGHFQSSIAPGTRYWPSVINEIAASQLHQTGFSLRGRDLDTGSIWAIPAVGLLKLSMRDSAAARVAQSNDGIMDITLTFEPVAIGAC